MERFRKIDRLAEFESDIKKLCRRYRTLEQDLETLIDAALFAYHKLNLDTGIVPISGLGKTRLPLFKVKKFACKSIPTKGNRTGLRLIYAYDQREDLLVLLEIYVKADQENESRERIKKYFGV